jgi:hypothetical protein
MVSMQPFQMITLSRVGNLVDNSPCNELIHKYCYFLQHKHIQGFQNE